MTQNVKSQVHNPQRYGAIKFKKPLKAFDLATLLNVFEVDDEGYPIYISQRNAELDSLKNLMLHNLIKIDIYQNTDDDYYVVTVTEAGAQLCEKMMEIAKS